MELEREDNDWKRGAKILTRTDLGRHNRWLRLCFTATVSFTGTRSAPPHFFSFIIFYRFIAYSSSIFNPGAPARFSSRLGRLKKQIIRRFAPNIFFTLPTQHLSLPTLDMKLRVVKHKNVVKNLTFKNVFGFSLFN